MDAAMTPDASRRLVLTVAGDPGGANAVAPVIIALRSGGRYRVKALAYRHARAVWAQRELIFDELSEATTTEEAAVLLCESNAALLLTTTSANGVDLEKRFLAAARRADVFSLAVLDFWTNYVLRFADDQGSLAFLPDRIAVMDERARTEMVAAGFDPTRLVVTGQPAFDELTHCRERATPDRRAAMRALWGIEPETTMIVFASQPLAVYGVDATSPWYLGYTEHSVLGALIPCLERLARRTGREIVLVIRPHPRENVADLERWGSDIIRVVVSDAGDGRDVALAADLVTGMNTALLVEAALMECVVASLQPGLRGSDVLPTNHCGMSVPVYGERYIEPVLERLLFDPQARAEVLGRLAALRVVPDATQRVVRLIDSLVASRRVPERRGNSE